MRKHSLTITLGIVTAFLMASFDKGLIPKYPEYGDRIVDLFPILVIYIIIGIYFEIFIRYILFKLFYKDKIKFRNVIDNLLKKFSTLISLSIILNLIITSMTYNKIVLFIPSLAITCVECFIIYDYLKKIDSSSWKKYIILAIIFIFSFII